MKPKSEYDDTEDDSQDVFGLLIWTAGLLISAIIFWAGVVWFGVVWFGNH